MKKIIMFLVLLMMLAGITGCQQGKVYFPYLIAENIEITMTTYDKPCYTGTIINKGKASVENVIIYFTIYATEKKELVIGIAEYKLPGEGILNPGDQVKFEAPALTLEKETQLIHYRYNFTYDNIY